MYKHILFPIDINDKSSWRYSMLRLAELYSLSPNTKITVMTVVQTYGIGMLEEYFPKDWVKEVSKKSLQVMQDIFTKNFKPQNMPGDNANIDINYHVAIGTIYEEIIDHSHKAGVDLILMGSHNPNRSDYLLGPNAAKIVRHASVSVLVVRN